MSDPRTHLLAFGPGETGKDESSCLGSSNSLVWCGWSRNNYSDGETCEWMICIGSARRCNWRWRQAQQPSGQVHLTYTQDKGFQHAHRVCCQSWHFVFCGYGGFRDMPGFPRSMCSKLDEGVFTCPTEDDIGKLANWQYRAAD